MREFFLEGGVGMFPTAFFGVTSLVLSVFYALQPRSRLLPLIAGLGAASLLAGGLGMVMGLKATFAAVARHEGELPELPRIALAGASESSNNLIVALGFTIVVALAVGLGGFRARRPTLEPTAG